MRGRWELGGQCPCYRRRDERERAAAATTTAAGAEEVGGETQGRAVRECEREK